MEEAYASHRRRMAIFVLSCCAHIAVLFLILHLNHETITHNPENHSELVNDIKSQLDYEASILAQSPQTQGATVMFADEPTSMGQTEDNSTTAAQPEKPLQEIKQEKKEQEQEITPSEIVHDSAPQEKSTQEATTDTPFVDAVEKKPVAQKPVKKSSGSSGSQAVTLAQITKGFLKSMYQERGAVPDHELDAQTIARQAYTSKVWHILRQSVNAHKRYITLRENVNTNTVLSLLIGKDGTLLDIHLERPLENRDVEAIESTIVRAATSTGLYPPIPAQFHADTLTLRFPLNIRGHQGMHSYELNYNN